MLQSKGMKSIWLVAALLVVGASLWATLSTGHMEKHGRYEDMLAAANKMIEATEAVKGMRLGLGIAISNEDDPNCDWDNRAGAHRYYDNGGQSSIQEDVHEPGLRGPYGEILRRAGASSRGIRSRWGLQAPSRG